jgi:phenylacetate-coenzyme A ligase PaaK-like adenylate-forming protein
VELAEQTAKNPQADLDGLRCRIIEQIHNVTGLSPNAVELVKPGELPRTEGKAKRVIDMRSGKT